MLTLKDCADVVGLTLDEVEAVAAHDGLPQMLAVGRAAGMLDQDWGNVALRQMIRDDADRAHLAGREVQAEAYLLLLAEATERHPGGRDRRQAPRG